MSRSSFYLLAGLSFEEVVSLLDDILVYSCSFEDHMATLCWVFQKFREANLKLSPEIYNWLQQETTILGFSVSGNGIATPSDKIDKVKHFPTLHSPKDVCAFLELASYYRDYIPDFAKIAFPLTQLLCNETLKQRHSFWSDACESAF